MKSDHQLLVQHHFLEFRQMLKHLLRADGMLLVDGQLLGLSIPPMKREAPVCKDQALLHRRQVQLVLVLALHNLAGIGVEGFQQGEDQVLSQGLNRALRLGLHGFLPLCRCLYQEMKCTCWIWIQKKNELICTAQAVHFLIVTNQQSGHGGEQSHCLVGPVGLQTCVHGLVVVVCLSSAWSFGSPWVLSQVQTLVQHGRQSVECLQHLIGYGLVWRFHTRIQIRVVLHEAVIPTATQAVSEPGKTP